MMKWICVLAFFGLFCFVQGAYDDSRCGGRGGRCQYTTTPCFDGRYFTGLCDGSSSRRCCIRTANDDSRCTGNGGRCQNTSSPCSDGRYYSGLCQGPISRRCCIPNEYDDSRCTDREGRCQYTSTPCQDGMFHTGLCGGPSSRRCCIAYDDSRCHDRGGRCQNTSEQCPPHPGGGERYLRGLCDGPRNRQCCREWCTDYYGQCQNTSLPCPENRYFDGWCAGPSTRQCCIPLDGDNNSRCFREKGGFCQLESFPCPGRYLNNMCRYMGGRKCCVPTPTTTPNPEGCPEVVEMACEVLGASNVVAAKRHPSGMRDDAYPYNNLRDICNEKKASRSSYNCFNGCFAPGGSTCLSPSLMKYLVYLKKTGLVIRINELAGACHSCRSRHYSGLAVDLHRPSPDRGQFYMDQCRRHGGWALNESTHVHCQFYDTDHPNWQP